MGKQWYWGIAGLSVGVAIGFVAPGLIQKLEPAPAVIAPPPPSADRVQRETYIAECIEAAKGSIETPSTLRIIGKPKYVRHSRDGRFYLDVVLDYDFRNTFGATVRRTGSFCALSIDTMYGKIDKAHILVDGITNFDLSINELRKNIPESRLVEPDTDISEFQYALDHGT